MHGFYGRMMRKRCSVPSFARSISEMAMTPHEAMHRFIRNQVEYAD